MSLLPSLGLFFGFDEIELPESEAAAAAAVPIVYTHKLYEIRSKGGGGSSSSSYDFLRLKHIFQTFLSPLLFVTLFTEDSKFRSERSSLVVLPKKLHFELIEGGEVQLWIRSMLDLFCSRWRFYNYSVSIYYISLYDLWQQQQNNKRRK